MCPAPNDQNTGLMFSVAKPDQPDKPRFVTNCNQRNLAIYKKETPLPYINKLIELDADYLVWYKIDFADGYFNSKVEESSEKWSTIQTTHCRIKNGV